MFHVPVNKLPKTNYIFWGKTSQTTLRAEDNYECSEVPETEGYTSFDPVELDARRCLQYSAKFYSAVW
jgi:hypothetical protein